MGGKAKSKMPISNGLLLQRLWPTPFTRSSTVVELAEPSKLTEIWFVRSKGMVSEQPQEERHVGAGRKTQAPIILSPHLLARCALCCLRVTCLPYLVGFLLGRLAPFSLLVLPSLEGRDLLRRLGDLQKYMKISMSPARFQFGGRPSFRR